MKTLLLFLLITIHTIAVFGANTESGNDYFKQKYGIFVHYGWGGDGTNDYGCTITEYADGTLPDSLNETANNFDVEGFVDNLAEMSPEYLIFTIWHCGMNPLYPSDVQDKWLGTGHCSQRDVMQELLDACEEKGIDVYFYTQPSAGNSMSPESQDSVGFINNSKYTLTYNDYINELYAELTTRYKTQLKGFWFDKGLGFGCVDAPRLAETIRAILPNAVMIKNGFASDAPAAADYGAVEVMSVTTNLEDEGYADADDQDVDTWPAFDRSVSFVSDRAWSSQSGSLRYTSEEMFKYTVLEAGVNEEGGGVAWALGPYPTDTISWNRNVLSGMTGLGTMIDEVGESVKGTIPSDSWPTAEGARIQELIWGVATRSADGNYEYLHVLNSPSGTTLTIDAPADNREYISAINLRTGNDCSFSQTANEVSITLHSNDSWHQVDAVIKLAISIDTTEIDTSIIDTSIIDTSAVDSIPTATEGVAIMDSSNEKLKVYPNPVTDNIFINVLDATDDYLILNGAGKTILRGKISGKTTEVDVSQLPSGVYQVQVGEHKQRIYKTDTSGNDCGCPLGNK